MTWHETWRAWWRTQTWPRVWVAGMAALTMAHSALSAYVWQGILHLWASRPSSSRGAAEVLAWRMTWVQLTQWALTGLTAAALAWLYMRLARQDPRLAHRWPTGGRGWLVAFLRLIVAWVVFSVMLWVGSVVVVPPLLLSLLVFLSCGLWPFLVFGLALWLVWWLMPWVVNFFVAAVLEHPAPPATIVKRWWVLTRTWTEDVFRPLASYSLLWILVWALPRMLGARFLTDLVRATLDNASVAPGLSLWWWGIAVVTAGVAAAGLAYVHIGWVLAYLEVRRQALLASERSQETGGVL